MKAIVLSLLIFFISCRGGKESKSTDKNTTSPVSITKTDDNLLRLEHNVSENFIKIFPPMGSNFSLPDSTVKTEPVKYGDFNADGKLDVMVYLGACGSGGCMYGLFLKQHDSFYRLAFLDYLKGPQFEENKNDFWRIKSFEEIEPYNPTKLRVFVFAFDKTKYQYQLDTTFVYEDKGD